MRLFILIFLFPLLLQAEVLKILESDSEALQARFDLMREAKEEIFISYFIFGDDKTSIQFLAELREAIRRGVKVKLLVDAPFNKIPKEVATYLSYSTAELKRYNRFKFPKLGRHIRYRMHDKIFLVDGEHLIVGGRNIEDTYFGFGERNFVDRDLYIKGDLAKDAREYYLELFKAGHVSPMKKVRNRRRYIRKYHQEVKATLDTAYAQLNNHLYLKPSLIKDWRDEFFQVDDVEFFHDKVGLREKYQDQTTQEVLRLFRGSEESIVIDAPYLVLNTEFKTVLKDAITRGVQVRVLTNSLYSNDVALPQADYLNYRKELQNMGIELYEYYSFHTYHAKSFVIDGKISMIGSYNIDPRSFNLNTETFAIVESTTFSEALLSLMDFRLEKTYKIGDDGKPIGYSVANPGVKKKKVFFTNLLRKLLIKHIRHLL